MSHLVETVSDNTLSNTTLESLSDVEISSLNSNDTLVYQSGSSKFENTDQSAFGESRGASFGWALQQPGVGGSANTYDPVTRPFFAHYYYGASPSNTRQFYETGYTIYPQRINYHAFSWFRGIYVPAGTHLCKFSASVNAFTSTSEITVRFCTGPAAGTAPTTSNTSYVGPHFFQAKRQGRFNSIPFSVISTTNTSTFIGLRVVSSTSCALNSNPLSIVAHVQTL